MIYRKDLVIPGEQDIFWNEWRLNSNSTAYNISLSYELDGSLKEERLITSLTSLINTHDIFKIFFLEKGGHLYVQQRNSVDSCVEIIDISDSKNNDLSETITSEINQIRQYHFNLEKGPLFKIGLIKLSNTHYFLALCFHHILVDGLSEQYIIDYISAHYNEDLLSVDQPLSLTHYVDVKKSLLNAVDNDASRHFWKKEVAKIDLEGNEFNAIKSGESTNNKNGEYTYFDIDTVLVKDLKILLNKHETTWLCILMATYVITLHRLSDCEQLTICYATNCRPKELKRAIGCFINVLPLPITIKENLTFLDVLNEITRLRSQQKEHQLFPFLEIIKELRKGKGTDIQSSLTIGLMQTHIKTTGLILNGINVSPVRELQNEVIYDLCLEYEFIDNAIRCRLNYRKNHFDSDIITHFQNYFSQTLKCFLSDSNRSVHDFSLLDDHEKQKLLFTWNNTETKFTFDRSLLELITEHTSKIPDKTALIFQDELLSYDKLEARIVRIGSYLYDHCPANHASIIPIILPNNIHRPIAMLSVLKSGSAYVPIDPEYPAQRIATILQDCEPTQLITSVHLQDKINNALVIAKLRHVKLFFIEYWEKNATSVNPLPKIKPENLAYIMYTSGSTGTPKGVKISHRSLLNFLFAMKNLLTFTSNEYFINITPYTFDISGLELYLPLLTGACCVVADDRSANNGHLLSSLIDKYTVSFVQTTPTKWQLLIDTGWQTTRIPTLLCGGEAFSNALIEKLLARGSRVWNVYGPTETTIWSAAYPLNASAKLTEKSVVPIGKPIANTQVYVLDRHYQPVPVGCVGELYIGGESVALGYFKRDDLTKERFIVKPTFLETTSSNKDRSRNPSSQLLYKTGDSAKWLPDGNLLCLGRRDYQIKHHGYRIELTEIEAALLTHQNIKQAVVVRKKLLPSNQYHLIAYYTLNDDAKSALENDPRKYLLEQLPVHCIPSYFYKLHKLPLTSSGKIDRNQLAQSKITVTEKKAVNQSKSDNQLMQIWQDILHVNQIEPESNFFSLGGNSLSAIHIAYNIEKVFSIECSAKIIFDNANFHQLSLWIKSQSGISATKHFGEINKTKRCFPIPLSSAQKRFWLLSELSPVGSYNSLLAWKLNGDLNLEALTQAFNMIRKRYEILRTVYKKKNGELCQEIYDYSPLDINAEKVTESDSISIMAQENITPFSLDKAPPIRIRILYVNSTYYILLINLYHILFDERSINLLIEKLSNYYQNLSNKQAVSEPWDHIQYADYACWEKQYNKSQGAKDIAIFWKNYLSGYKPISLLGDRTCDESQTTQLKFHTFNINEEQMNALHVLCQKHETTLFLTFLSALYILVAKYTGQYDLTIAVPISLRDSKKLNFMLGSFINTLPLRAKFHEKSTFKDILMQVRETFLSAFHYKNVSFDILSQYLVIDRTENSNSNLPILMTWENKNIKKKLKFPNVTVEKINIGNAFPKADLNFNLIEGHSTIFGKIEYASAVYSEIFIDSLVESFIKIISTFSNKLNQNIHEFIILSENKYNKIIYQWNNTKRNFSADKTICQLFEIQAKRVPEKTAICCNEKSITYRDLIHHVNFLSLAIEEIVNNKINNFSTTPIIALYLNRDINMIATMLAIMKIGAAYLPLSLDLPQDRLKYMLKNVSCDFVISNDNDFFKKIGIKNISLEEIQKKSKKNSIYNPIKPCHPSSPAYIIYTSGSTGLPKGTIVSHKSVVNCIYSIAHKLNINSKDALLSVTDYSFDVSVIDFFMPLLLGSKVIILDDTDRKDPKKIVSMLLKENITLMQATPSVWNQLVKHGWISNDCFKILSAGEPLNEKLTRALLARGILYNIYGPTEATIYSTLAKINSIDQLSIGKPIDNVKCYILDSYLKPVPIGVYGELYIGGSGVALGYVNDEKLTAERFVINPFCENEKMYKTGDLVRWLHEGNIEYRGRLDNQIKLRGYRIELSEIENQLLLNSMVQDAVVVLKSSGEKSHLIAFIIANNSSNYIQYNLKNALMKKLPSYMVPRYFIECSSFPLTMSGKIDRIKLLNLYENGRFQKPKFGSENDFKNSIQNKIKKIFESILDIKIDSINQNIFDLGMNSLLLVNAQNEIEKSFNLSQKIELIDLFKYTTIADLANYLGNFTKKNFHYTSETTVRSNSKPDSNDIAIIGLSGEFPGAKNIEQFWENICKGKESITHFSNKQLEQWGVPKNVIKQSNYVKSKGIIENAEYFDAKFFNMSPNEATLTDPQQRLLIEHAWCALEIAGYSTQKYKGCIGVYAGSDESNYVTKILQKNASCLDSADDFQTFIASGNAFLSTKISYKLNLTGPSLNINTACSTGLVVVAIACQQLLDNQCDMAIAGSVSIKQPQQAGYFYQNEGITSSDGHCRPFSQKADGTVPSAGVGAVLLKRLDDAVRDKDYIYAIIKGFHINNDGSSKAGYTAPSITQQARCVSAAIDKAGINADTLQYVEMHGTGTKLGDPIEVEALNEGFRRTTTRTGFCAIGSVKSNIGHADAAAGMAGLIKTIQALRSKTIPATLHCDEPNVAINFRESVFYINNKTVPWESNNIPRRAGINSLGLGGTNAFLVLEESPITEKLKNKDAAHYILPFSAKTPTALSTTIENFYNYIVKITNQDTTFEETDFLKNMAHTLQLGRDEFQYRDYIVADSISDLTHQLKLKIEISSKGQLNYLKAVNHDIVFFFPGQGTQYIGMGYALYQSEPVFKNAIDDCIQRLTDYLKIDLKTVLFPMLGDKNDAKHNIHNTKYTQPVLFCIEYALAKLWDSWGIQPTALIGHSFGEYVAAQIAGIFNLDDILKLVVYRAELISQLPLGKMFAINISTDKLRPFLNDKISIATISSPTLCVISGDEKSIHKLRETLIQNNIVDKRKMRMLNTSHAFHSKMMEDAVSDFIRFLKTIKMNPPETPIISNLTGQFSSDTHMATPEYWAKHLVSTVQLSDSIKIALDTLNTPLFITLGPGGELQSLINCHLSNNKRVLHVSTMTSASQYKVTQMESERMTYQALAKVWSTHSGRMMWDKFSTHVNARRMPLPTYPFERKPYWPTMPDKRQSNPSLVSTDTLENWFYKPSWQRLESIHSIINRDLPVISEHCWIVFVENDEVGNRLETNINLYLDNVIYVVPGKEFSKITRQKFFINPNREEDYASLIDDIIGLKKQSYCVLNFWSYEKNSSLNCIDDRLSKSFYHLFYLSKVFVNHVTQHNVYILNIATELFSVFEEDSVCPAIASFTAFSEVIPFECSNIKIKCLDIMNYEEIGIPSLVKATLFEVACLMDENEAMHVAYRKGYRWQKEFMSVNLNAKIHSTTKPTLLNKEGVYLIIGGLSGIGLEIAKKMILEQSLHVVLLSRRTIPDKHLWNDWLNEHSPDDKDFNLIALLNSMQLQGGNFDVISADITSFESMKMAVKKINQEISSIKGIIHSAGIAGSGLIANKSKNRIEKVLSSKLQGTYVLSKLFRDIPLDFVLFFSSITSVTGGIGQLEYCAANACLDCLPNANLFHKNTRVLIINWNRWKNTGMVAFTELEKNSGFPENYEDVIDSNSITKEQGYELFSKAIYSFENQLIVSKFPLKEYKKMLMSEAKQIFEQSAAPKKMKADNLEKPETKLITLLKNLLGLNTLDIKDNFFDLGGHSLMALQLLDEIKKEFGTDLLIADIYQAKNIENLIDLVTNKQSRSTPTSYVIPMKQSGIQPPLFLIHPVGGAVFCYIELVKMLKYDGPVYAIQDPGLTSENYKFTTLENMAAFYLKDIQLIYPFGPYRLAGFSLGGTIAFEIAYQLTRNGFSVDYLGLIDSWAVFYDYSKDEFENSIKRQLEMFKSDLEKLGHSNFKSLLPCQLSRMQLLQKYKPKPISVGLYLYKASECLPQYVNIQEKDNHWQRYIDYGIQTSIIPGNHETILKKQNVSILADLINQHLSLIVRSKDPVQN